MRFTTNEVEGLFNQIRGNNHDNLPQYPNTLAAKDVYNDANDKFLPMDVAYNNNDPNKNRTTKQFRQTITNYLVNKANTQQ